MFQVKTYFFIPHGKRTYNKHLWPIEIPTRILTPILTGVTTHTFTVVIHNQIMVGVRQSKLFCVSSIEKPNQILELASI